MSIIWKAASGVASGAMVCVESLNPYDDRALVDRVQTFGFGCCKATFATMPLMQPILTRRIFQGDTLALAAKTELTSAVLKDVTYPTGEYLYKLCRIPEIGQWTYDSLRLADKNPDGVAAAGKILQFALKVINDHYHGQAAKRILKFIEGPTPPS